MQGANLARAGFDLASESQKIPLAQVRNRERDDPVTDPHIGRPDDIIRTREDNGTLKDLRPNRFVFHRNHEHLAEVVPD